MLLMVMSSVSKHKSFGPPRHVRAVICDSRRLLDKLRAQALVREALLDRLRANTVECETLQAETQERLDQFAGLAASIEAKARSQEPHD